MGLPLARNERGRVDSLWDRGKRSGGEIDLVKCSVVGEVVDGERLVGDVEVSFEEEEEEIEEVKATPVVDETRVGEVEDDEREEIADEGESRDSRKG